MALLTYIINVYPKGISIHRLVDPLVRSIMEEDCLPASWPTFETLTALNGYKQQEEKESRRLEDEWHNLEPPKGFVKVVSLST